MRVIETIEQMRQVTAAVRKHGQRVGFVPTMGALHAGHGSLIERARRECGFVVVSIFVNPTQFGPGEDLNKYPRPFEADIAYCQSLGADAVFAPSPAQMYPSEQISWVDVEQITEGLCGSCRPGHFRGVATVCTKLFNIVGADVAYFGQKDAQQAAVICRMVADLNIPIHIEVCPIVREPDGLAMSSRNRYLSSGDRQKAVCLYQALSVCRDEIKKGQKDTQLLAQAMTKILIAAGGNPEYVAIVDTQSLKPILEVKDRALVALACRIGTTRLIDNMVIDLNSGLFLI